MLITIEEAAEYLRFHPSTVYRLARQGLLPARKIGKQWRLDSRALDRWLTETHEPTQVLKIPSRHGEHVYSV